MTPDQAAAGIASMVRRGFADTPEGQVFYIEQGAGEPLVLLHQSPRSSSMYRDVLPLLAAHHRAIAIDLLGYGQSAPPPVVDGQADVIDVSRNVVHVLDALGIERSHVFGFHTGAQIAAQIAANWPDRVGALILGAFGVRRDRAEVDEFYASMGAYGVIPKQSLDGSHLTKIWMKAYSEVQKYWWHSRNPPDEPGNTARLLRAVSPHRATYTFLTERELAFIDRYVVDSLNAKYVHQLYQSTISTDPRSLLPRIQVPTLHIAPDSPHESPFNKRGDEVREMVPDCETLTLADSDDNLAEFKAAELAEMMLAFLRKHRLGDGLSVRVQEVTT